LRATINPKGQAQHFFSSPGEPFTFVLKDWKKGGTGRPRIIYFTDQFLAEVIRPLMERYPTGPLFRNQWRRRWQPQIWGENFRHIRKKLGLRQDIFAYGYRHRHCTELLKAKVPLAYVVEAMGHKGPKTIFDVYSHLIKENASIRAELNRVAASSAAASKPANLPGCLM
jgi:integrase